MLQTLIDPHSVRRYDREGGKHAHDHAQVLFGINGTLHVKVEGQGAWVDATSGLVVPPGASHTYCADRTARVLVLDDLAALCRMSPQRLRARFTQALGQSPQAFVRARRLNRAEEMLRRGFPLENVALQVGYSTASALSTALRRDRGSGARSLRKSRAFLES